MRDGLSWAVIVCFGVLMAVIIGAAIADCNKREACRDHGGRIDEYNCQTIINCHPVGKSTICTPSRVCDWRCIDVPAEQPTGVP